MHSRVILTVELIARNLLRLTLTVTRAIRYTLSLRRITISIIPNIKIVSRTVLGADNRRAVNVLLTLLVTLMMRNTTTGRRRTRNGHGRGTGRIRCGTNVRRRQPFSTTRYRNTGHRHRNPHNATGRRTTTCSFGSVSRRGTSGRRHRSSDSIVSTGRRRTRRGRRRHYGHTIISSQPRMFGRSVKRLRYLPVIFYRVRFPAVGNIVQLYDQHPEHF